MIKVKRGVVFKRFKPCFFMMVNAVNAVWKLEVPGIEAVITRGCEYDLRSLLNSKHYEDEAIDVRNNNLTKEQKEKCTNNLQTLLGKDYDVVLKKHLIHIEYDPK